MPTAPIARAQRSRIAAYVERSRSRDDIDDDYIPSCEIVSEEVFYGNGFAPADIARMTIHLLPVPTRYQVVIVDNFQRGSNPMLRQCSIQWFANWVGDPESASCRYTFEFPSGHRYQVGPETMVYILERMEIFGAQFNFDWLLRHLMTL